MSRSHTADPSLIPDIEDFEERAAIAQYHWRLTLDEAEDLAVQDQRFGSAADYWHWLASYVANRGLAYANQNKPRPAAHCEWSGGVT